VCLAGRIAVGVQRDERVGLIVGRHRGGQQVDLDAAALEQGGSASGNVQIHLPFLLAAADGAGLQPGKGTGAQGEKIYAAKCQACHGEKGAGRPNDRLVGGLGSLAPDKGPAVKTVGSYWPYATTLFDYVRRAMPWDRPKSLTDEEVYGVAAYILYLNGLIGQDDVLDAQSLPKVKMPNREGFTAFPRWPPK